MTRIAILGPGGRIGGALARRIAAERPDCELLLIGRRGEALAGELQARFVHADVSDVVQLASHLAGCDLVVHTAGPFQHTEPRALAAAIGARVAYLDISDDLPFAHQARHASDDARAGVAAIVNGGIFPGLSNVMAGALIERGRERGVTAAEERVELSYFVAGTGGAGPAVMSSTFLLSAIPATERVGGERVDRRAFTGRRVVEFPAPAGRRACFYLELPEVSSCFEVYGVPNISARFGTAPGVWNYSTRSLQILPKSFLGDRRKVSRFVSVLLPLLRAVDKLVGDAVAMRVDVLGRDGVQRSLRYAAPHTVDAIVTTLLAQMDELLEHRVPPGVHWPEEGIIDKERHIARASEGALLEDVVEQESAQAAG